MIKIDMKTGLLRVWEAFNAQQLQAQTRNRHSVQSPDFVPIGFYCGPCAIGAMMTPDERQQADHGYNTDGSFTYVSVASLWERHVVSFNDEPDAKSDAVVLQRAHDNWLFRPSKQTLDTFVLTLQELTTKYGVEFPEATAS